MRFLSLFSGIEAASSALIPLGWECVGVAEIDPGPCKVLAHHYPGVPNLSDVTKITEAQIASLGRIDAIIFGSPCQDLSLAGKRKGFDGSRSSLFFDATRIVRWARRHNKLRFAIWENVFGAFSSNQGRDFAAVVREMAGLQHLDVPKNGWGNEGAALGDDGMVEWGTLDAQWSGVAQRRRRVFVVADFGDWAGRPPILLERQSLRGDHPPRREAGKSITHPIAPCLTSSGRGVERGGDTRGQDPVVAVVVSTLDASYARLQGASGQDANHGHSHLVPIAFNARQDPDAWLDRTGPLDTDGGTQAVCITGDITHTLKAEGFDASEDATGRGQPIVAHAIQASALRLNPDSGPDGVGVQADVAYTLEARSEVQCAQMGMAVRRLTPRECERLQAFEDDHTLVPVKKIKPERAAKLQAKGDPVTCIDGQWWKMSADGPRYKAIGNSMCVNVIALIGNRIDQALAHERHQQTACAKST